MKCHPDFHISLLRPADTEYILFPESRHRHLSVSRFQAYFTMDYIMGLKLHNLRRKQKKYLIKWEGYPLWKATKEPAETYTRMSLMLLKTTGPITLKIHLSQIPNSYHRHTDHHLDSTHNIHHTHRYRIFSRQQQTAKDNASCVVGFSLCSKPAHSVVLPGDRPPITLHDRSPTGANLPRTSSCGHLEGTPLLLREGVPPAGYLWRA